LIFIGEDTDSVYPIEYASKS